MCTTDLSLLALNVSADFVLWDHLDPWVSYREHILNLSQKNAFRNNLNFLFYILKMALHESKRWRHQLIHNDFTFNRVAAKTLVKTDLRQV